MWWHSVPLWRLRAAQSAGDILLLTRGWREQPRAVMSGQRCSQWTFRRAEVGRTTWALPSPQYALTASYRVGRSSAPQHGSLRYRCHVTGGPWSASQVSASRHAPDRAGVRIQFRALHRVALFPDGRISPPRGSLTWYASCPWPGRNATFLYRNVSVDLHRPGLA